MMNTRYGQVFEAIVAIAITCHQRLAAGYKNSTALAI